LWPWRFCLHVLETYPRVTVPLHCLWHDSVTLISTSLRLLISACSNTLWLGDCGPRCAVISIAAWNNWVIVPGHDGDVLLFVCLFVCAFVRLSPEARTCRALAWLAHQCWWPWAAGALLDQSCQCVKYWWGRGGLPHRLFGRHWLVCDWQATRAVGSVSGREDAMLEAISAIRRCTSTRSLPSTSSQVSVSLLLFTAGDVLFSVACVVTSANAEVMSTGLSVCHSVCLSVMQKVISGFTWNFFQR